MRSILLPHRYQYSNKPFVSTLNELNERHRLYCSHQIVSTTIRTTERSINEGVYYYTSIYRRNCNYCSNTMLPLCVSARETGARPPALTTNSFNPQINGATRASKQAWAISRTCYLYIPCNSAMTTGENFVI